MIRPLVYRLPMLVPIVALAACGPAPLTTPSPAAGHASAIAGASATKGGVYYLVDAVSHGGPYDSPSWISSRPGLTDRNTYFTTWPGDAVVVMPDAVGSNGCAAPSNAPSPRSPYELRDDGNMAVRQRSGVFLGVTFYIQDVGGQAGIMHNTDEVPVSSVEQLSGGGFVLHVHQDHRLVYRLKSHTGGPRVATVGCISIGDVVYTYDSQQ